MRRRWQSTLIFDRIKIKVKAICSIFYDAYKNFSNDNIALAIGSISFFTFLSLVPLTLLAVKFAAPYFFGFLDAAQNTIGPTLYRSLNLQLEAVKNIRELPLIIALGFGLWSGGNIFLNLEAAMNIVWKAPKQRPLWRRRILAIFMIFIFALFFTMSFLSVNFIRLVSMRLISLNIDIIPDITIMGILQAFTITIIIPTILIVALFATIYFKMPNVKVPLKYVFPGAISAAIAWTISLHVFSWFASYNFDRYQIIYGSLTSIMLLLLWLFYSSYILMFGAELSAAVYRYKTSKQESEEEPLT